MKEKLEKSSKYFEMLHPDSELETLSEEEYKRVLRDKTFIRENLDGIDLKYQTACSTGIQPEEAIRGAVRLEKTNKYFEMLHPDSEFETLSKEEYKKVLSDKNFIRENLDKIELMYENARSTGMEPEEAIKGAVRLEKSNKYFKMLHPDSELETLSKEEYKKVLSDKTFIRENLDKIELMYENARSTGMEPEEAIKGAVRLSKKISTKDIENVTKDALITTKRSAQQVEDTEIGKENTNEIEGEEVGNDK